MTPQDEAEIAALRRAAEATPGDVSRWAAYVGRLARAGLKSRARKTAKAAKVAPSARQRLIDIADGRAAPSVAPLADALRAGDADRAWEVGRAFSETFPKDAVVANLLGVAALMRSDPRMAEATLRRAHALDPASPDIAANLALSLTRQGRGGEAIALLRPFAGRSDAPLAVLTNLASAYLRADRPDEALSVSLKAREHSPEDMDVIANYADALLRIGEGEQALEVLTPHQGQAGFPLPDLWADALMQTGGDVNGYLETLAVPPPEIALRLAERLAEMGLLDHALTFAKIAVAGRDKAGAFRLISLLGTWEEDSPLLPQLERLAADANLNAAARGRAGLALGKAYLDIGRDDEAFDAMEAGNAALRTLVDYDVADEEITMAALADEWSAGRIKEMSLEGGPSLVFIVGLPRTGSTLAETILSRHPDVTALGETPRLFEAAFEAKTPDRIAELRAVGDAIAPDSGVATDKLLANFLNLGAIAAALPNARFIEVTRDYPATALSIFQAELPLAAHPYGTDLNDLARYIVAYDRLMAHWRATLGDRFTRIAYENLVGSPDETIPALVAAAGLSMHPVCLSDAPSMRRINTLSVAQARAPLSTGSVARWRRHEHRLKPLLDHLREHGITPAT